MTDRYKVYTKVLKVLKERLSLSHPGHVLTLAMLMAGIVISRKAQLSAVSAETATKAKDKSTEMRLRRWLKHDRIDTFLIGYFQRFVKPESWVQQGFLKVG